MRKIHCINAISQYGTDQFTEDYELTDEVNEAEGILVRSASLHEMQFSTTAHKWSFCTSLKKVVI